MTMAVLVAIAWAVASVAAVWALRFTDTSHEETSDMTPSTHTPERHAAGLAAAGLTDEIARARRTLHTFGPPTRPYQLTGPERDRIVRLLNREADDHAAWAATLTERGLTAGSELREAADIRRTVAKLAR